MYRSGFPYQKVLIKHVMRMERLPVLFPPPVTYYSSNGEWCESKINDTGIESLTGSFSHLLGRARTDGALGKTFH